LFKVGVKMNRKKNKVTQGPRQKPSQRGKSETNSKGESTHNGNTVLRNWSPDSESKILLGIILVLLVLLVALLMKSSMNGLFELSESSDDLDTQTSTQSKQESIHDEFVRIDSGVSCSKLMESAQYILDNRPMSEWEEALDLLATCALQEENNANPRWNLAVALLKMDRGNEAMNFIDEALSLDPTNIEFLKTGGAYLAKHGNHTEAIKCIEYYMEVTLHVPSWEELLATISVLREDEWEFLHEAGDDVIQVLEILQASYLKTASLIKAGYLYKVLIGLKGDNAELELLGTYSAFAFGLGDIATGIKYLRLYTERQYVTQGYGGPGQAFEVVTAHSLRLLTAGFDSTINSIVKNLLSGGDPIWDELVYNCDMQETGVLNYSISVKQSDVRKILIQCLIVQDVIGQLVTDGAVLYAENIFGWTPFLHIASLGSPELLKVLLNIDPDPQSKTVLAHNGLHVAAMKGSYSVVEPLLRAGLKASDKDYFNKTALNIACLHRWTSKGMARALGQKLPQNCPEKLSYFAPPKLHPQGGWLGNNGIGLPKELLKEKCDFDVLVEPDVETFVFDYLSLQRPVLVRNATNNHQMKALYQKWQRNKFEQEFRTLNFKEVEVPYAESFGYTTTRVTSLKSFMGKMRRLNQEQKEYKSLSEFTAPTYIFETIALNSPILNDFKLPAILDPDSTNIDINKLQFYLGPVLSGSPIHFHRNAWNILIYGQKRWFLYPPDKAFYSKEHVWDWWKKSNQDGRWEGSQPLECVQYPGDMIFVPDMWGHGVINLKESIGLASEFIYGASEFSI